MVLPPLQMANDILPHDYGIVYQHPYGKGERHPGHDIQGHAEGVHDDVGGDDRDGEGYTGDDGRAPGVDETEHDQDGKYPADDQGILDIGQRIPGHDGAVTHHGKGHSWRELLFHLFDGLLDTVYQGYLVAARLFVDIKTDGRFAVYQGKLPLLLCA